MVAGARSQVSSGAPLDPSRELVRSGVRIALEWVKSKEALRILLRYSGERPFLPKKVQKANVSVPAAY